ncbi:MAG: hypothetical protein LBI18_10435 [Planctomycetaceae bacterium]|jgi:Leucine-rich repeat (LRR) protein|nr:hypothetical protein [Planctomycetaceae bacterium]
MKDVLNFDSTISILFYSVTMTFQILCDWKNFFYAVLFVSLVGCSQTSTPQQEHQSVQTPSLQTEQPTEPPKTSTPSAIKQLKLDHTEIGDADLKKIVAENPNLTELTLTGTKITDAGISYLTQLTKLKKIRISKTAISNIAAENLAKITTLEDIDVSQTEFGNTGLEMLKLLPRLKRLNLYTTKITDNGLDVLRDFVSAKTIVWLNIDQCPLTDVAITKLVPLENLEWLHLGRTELTDSGLNNLAQLKTLKEVSVTNTKVSRNGIDQLKTALPHCKINENTMKSGESEKQQKQEQNSEQNGGHDAAP